MSDPIQTGTVGIPIRLVLISDGAVHNPSTATRREITITRPDGTSTTKPANVGSTSDGRPCLEYITQAGDLEQAGPYLFTGYIEDAEGHWPAEPVAHYVHRSPRG